MKIEICEQMVQSWLQHIQLCEIVQTNWMISPKRLEQIASADVDEIQRLMKDVQARLNEMLEEELKAELQEAIDEDADDFEKTGKKKTITLVASVSYPMTDLYTPFSIVISDAGKMTISNYEDEIEYDPVVSNEN